VNELNIELKPQSISDLQTLLDNTVEDPEITGVSVSLVQRENMLWRGVAGFADTLLGIRNFQTLL